ncbi:MAG: ABC transporter permease [Alphaproteobacteria bacterium]
MRTLWGFIKKELIALLRDRVMLAAVLILPVLQVTLLSLAITMEARNLRLAIDTEPNDFIMERIYDHAIGSGWFIKIKPQQKSAVEAVRTGAADVALIAPKGGLTKALMRSEGQLQVLIDATNVLKAQSIEAYLKSILNTVLQEQMHTPSDTPITFTVRVLFNPQLDTQWFLIPALMAILVFMSLLTLISISITREKETGTIETLISAPISKYHIILGKTLPFIFIALLNLFIIQSVGRLLFDLPFRGSFWMFIAAFLLFCLPACAIAVWLATYTKTQQQAMLGLMIILFLAMMLSGALFPLENMPVFLQVVSYLNPLTHYTYLTRNILLKGGDWMYFVHHGGMLFATGIITAYFAVKRFKTTL